MSSTDSQANFNPPQPSPPESNSAVGGKLSTMMVTNIVIISIVGFVSILLLLFGDFEGKVSRVMSTLILFGLYTFFTSFSQREHRVSLHVPMSLVGNIYMLCLSLVLIWGTMGKNSYEDSFLVFQTLFIAGLIQLGLFLTRRIAIIISAPQLQLSWASILTAVGMSLTTILFTLPLGLDKIMDFGEGYWKSAIAVILFTGLMVSIMGLIIWAFKAKHVPVPAFSGDALNGQSVGRPAPVPVQAQPLFTPGQTLTPEVQHPTPNQTSPVQQQFQGAPNFSAPVAGSISWPVFPNGLPLPANERGRPDFGALQTVANMHAIAEQQFFKN